MDREKSGRKIEAEYRKELMEYRKWKWGGEMVRGGGMGGGGDKS